jgi:hypothetical protein
VGSVVTRSFVTYLEVTHTAAAVECESGGRPGKFRNGTTGVGANAHRAGATPHGALPVVGTAKYSEQNHNPKQKGFSSWKKFEVETPRILFESRFQDRHHVRSGLADLRRSGLMISPPDSCNSAGPGARASSRNLAVSATRLRGRADGHWQRALGRMVQRLGRAGQVPWYRAQRQRPCLRLGWSLSISNHVRKDDGTSGL